MVILLGAESSTGKTLMAQKLLALYQFPYLSIDNLKMGVFRANSHCGFDPNDSNEKIERHIWPIVRGIIEVTIENHQNIIIEGFIFFRTALKNLQRNIGSRLFLSLWDFLNGILKIILCPVFRNIKLRKKPMSIGEKIKELLYENKLTQKQLAEKLQIPPTTLSGYIRDFREPDVATLQIIATYFNITIDYLVGFNRALTNQKEKTLSIDEMEMLNVYRCLKREQQELLIEQGKLYINKNKQSK